VPDLVKQSFVSFDIRAPLTLRAERPSGQMSKITNDGLTALHIWQQWASKGLMS